MKRMQSVQGLRAIAAVLVVFVHLGGATGFTAGLMRGEDPFWLLHPIGNAGVDLFFAISGLIMIVTTTRVQHDVGNAGRFLLRRSIRIYPPYIVVTLVLFAPTLLHPGRFVHTAVLLQSISLWPTGQQLPILFVGWTLTYEMYFYLIFALSVLVPARYQLAIFAAWAALTVAVALTLAQVNPVLGMIGNPINLEFLFGVIVGKAVLNDRLRFPVASTAIGVAGVLAAYLLLAGPGAELPNTWLRVVAVGAPAALILYGVVGLEAEGRRLPAFINRLGELSFAMYLIHPLVMKVAGPVVRLLPATSVAAILVGFGLIAASLAAAGVFRWAVEQPLLTMLQRLTSRPLPARRVTAAPSAAS